MKKLFVALCLVIGFSLCSPHTASAGIRVVNGVPEEYTPTTAAYTNIWIAYPEEYPDIPDVYLHSTEKPEGFPILAKASDYVDVSFWANGWRCKVYQIEDLAPSDYWVTVDTSYSEFSGVGFPDMNFRSLLPNIDTKYTKVTIEADGDWGVPGHRQYNVQQFFCLCSKTETLDEDVKNIEEIFTGLVTAKMEEFDSEIFSLDSLVYHAFDDLQFPAHYDDYITWFKPYGCNLYQLFSEAADPMHQIVPGFSLSNGDMFYRLNFVYPSGMAYTETEDYLFRLREGLADSFIYKAMLFGWDFVLDTRNLEFDDNGDCTTKFEAKQDGTLLNMFLRNEDENIPKLPVVTKVDINDKSELLKFIAQADSYYEDTYIPPKDLGELVEIDYGEQKFNTVPNYNGSDSTIIPDEIRVVSSNKTAFSPTYIIIPIVVLLLLGIVIVVLVKKNKR